MIPSAKPAAGDVLEKGSAAAAHSNVFGGIDDPSFDNWDRSIEALLIALLAFGPAALGAVQPWSEQIVVCLATMLLACLVVKLFSKRRLWRPKWSWAHVPVALFVLMIAAQVLPLPSGVVGRLSPATVRLKQELLADLPDAGEALRRVTLSFAPAATRHDLSLVLAAAAVFVTVSATYRTSRQVRRLLAAVTLIGGAVALLALAQDITRADRLFWTIPTTAGSRADGGPFVNHGHFAQFMNLSIGAAVALLLVNLQKLTRDVSERAGFQAILGGWRHDVRIHTILLLAAMIVASLLAIALSMSRGGLLSTIVAGAVTITALMLLSRTGRSGDQSRDRSVAGVAVAVLGLIAFCALLYFGYDAVHERFASQGEALERADAGRLQILRDLRQVWAAFPLVGTGLGTHRFVFPMFDRSGSFNLAVHAENEYAQLLEETGGIGLALAVVFIAIIFVACVKATRGHRSIHAAAFGLGYGLLAVLIHSVSDFGQHIPANACLTAALCGLLVVLPRMQSRRGSRRESSVASTSPTTESKSARSRSPRWPIAALSATMLAALAFSIPGADAARCADEHWTQARRIESALRAINWEGGDDDYSALIAEAGEAAALQPDDVEFAYGLSLYRWQSIARPIASPLEKSDVQQFAAQIVNDLHAARRLAPTFGPPCTLAGEIELFSLGRRDIGRKHLRQGYRLSPQDTVAAMVVGRMEAAEGNIESSLAALRHAASLDSSLVPEAIKIYLDEEKRPDVAIEFVGDDAAALFSLADELTRRRADAALIATAHERAMRLLRERCDRPDASAGELSSLAEICQKEGDFKGAITYWRRALVMQLTNAQWRLRLAQCLLQSGDRQGALREAEAVLRTQPRSEEAQQLVESLKKE
jgi:O-antigen ligase/tetratricopeptide (TPR) repeat protein